MEEEKQQQESKEKKQRKRMKAVYSQIREQMEFYFSDSNLQKDRFLKKQYKDSQDGFIELSLFLNFNRIRAITTEVNTIAKALSSSALLKVSEDGTKVKRLTPLLEPKDLDQRTVYVECLPHHVDHEWVKRLFSACGKVVYVSLPRYKSTKDPKGFAFVEFETIEAAKKACEELNNPPVEAEERAGRFPKTSKTLLYWQKKAGNPSDEKVEQSEIVNQDEPKTKVPESPTKLSKRQKKHKRQESDSSIDGTASDVSPVKRRKTLSKDSSEGDKSLTESEGQSVSEGLKSEEDDGGPRKKRKKRKSRSKTDPGNMSSENEVSESTANNQDIVRESKKRKASGRESVERFEPPSKVVRVENDNSNKLETENDRVKDSEEKKKRKRKRKKKNKEKDLPELRVISKSQWLLLRNEYLQLQKKNMIELKKKLITTEKESSSTQNKENKGKEKSNKPVLEFIPNVIVEVKSTDSLCRKKLREHIGPDVQVAYIDVQDGQHQGYIRFKDKNSAMKISNSTSASYTFKLIQGADEKSYWDKLQSDRNAKYEKTNTKSKKRGAQKLIDKAQKINKENVERKHIVFDD